MQQPKFSLHQPLNNNDSVDDFEIELNHKFLNRKVLDIEDPEALDELEKL